MLGVISEQDGRHLWKNIETSRNYGLKINPGAGKYEGLAFHLEHRIYIAEYDTAALAALRGRYGPDDLLLSVQGGYTITPH